MDNPTRHMKTKGLALITLSALAIAFVLFALQQRVAPAQQAPPAGLDLKIIAKLSEIVAIRERIFQSYQLNLEAGRAPVDGTAALELAEARVDQPLITGRDQ